MKLSLVKTLAAGSALLLPTLALAATTIGGLIDILAGLVDRLIPLTVAAAVLVFFWGLVVFIFNAGNEDKRKEGRQVMLWGIVALFVMVSIWGLVRILQQTLQITDNQSITTPTVNTQRGISGSGVQPRQ